MIKEIEISKFNKLLKKNKIEINMKETNNHKSWLPLEMRSEDGTNFLQGLSLMEIYETKKGICGKVNLIWINPKCRKIGFGKALLENIERYATDRAKSNGGLVAIISSSYGENMEAINATFKSCGYDVTNGRGRSNIGKSF